MEDIKNNFINNNKIIFTDNFINIVKDEINMIFPILNIVEKDILTNIIFSLLTCIFFQFHFATEFDFYNKLQENDYQDLRKIIFLLFPYIDDKNNFENYKRLTKLGDISKLKNKNNEYITKIQYSRRLIKEQEQEEDYEWNLMDLYNNYIVSIHAIHKCANHLYCNWINIIPLTLDSYPQSALYKATIKEMKKTNNKYNDNKNEFAKMITYEGLSINKYYHVIINDLYLDVLPYKWLMYEYYDPVSKSDIMYIEYIFKYFGYIFQYSNDPSKYRENESNFIENWKLFLITDIEIQKNIIKYILIHFDFKYHTYDDSGNSSNNIYNVDTIYELDDDKDISRIIDQENIDILIQNCNDKKYVKKLYIFLIDTIYNFSLTWYGKLMFSNIVIDAQTDSNLIYNNITKIKDIFFNKKTIFKKQLIENSYISYKNIYNFAKSLLILKNDNNQNIINKITEWDSLKIGDQNDIVNKLNSDTNNWFNIRSNINRKYSELRLDNIKIYEINNEIWKSIKINLTEIVFDCLVRRGILSEFKVKVNEDEIKNSFENSYYFITQEQYKYIYPTRENNKQKIENTFDEKIISKQIKLNYYALDWVQQIHFFKHFFNNRVMYITGATGVGKSTQVPKLLIYGLILIGNYDSKILHTQPRINATQKNTAEISYQMGLPIKTYEYNKLESEPTTNFWVQYNTEKEKHSSKHETYINNPKNYIEIATDGILLNILNKNRLLKNSYKIKENKKITNIVNKYNVYNVIVIDEAHEHGQNIDLSLTLLRDAVHINNSIRLVIITATIEEDESRYRQYFRDISDEYMYPFNRTLKYNELKDDKIYNSIVNLNLTDQINIYNSIDRLLHISKPLATTLYNIKDIYLPPSSEIKTYKDAQKEGIQKTLELTKVLDGDILFFSTSVNKIKEIVNELNNSSEMPHNWVALPYYSELPKKWITKIDNIKLNTPIELNVRRIDIINSLSNNIELNNKKVYKYDRVIIVSTNIAEASITINSLKAVIDTGYQINVYYDPVKKYTLNEEIMITDTSRIQRRGRVGRTQDGAVYYMYKKDLNKTKKKYPITLKINDLIYELCKMIYQETDEELNKYDYIINIDVILDQYNHHYEKKFKKVNFRNKDDIIDDDELNINENIYNLNPSKYRKYIINEMKGIFKNTNLKHLSGYDINTIIDVMGTFYLIHPFELGINVGNNKYEVIRNKFTENFKKPLDIKIVEYFEEEFNELFKLRLITIEKDILSYKKIFSKTNLYNLLEELQEKIRPIIGNLTFNEIWTIILGEKYNLLEEVLWVNTIVSSVNGSSIEKMSRKKSTKSGKEISDNTLLLQNFGSYESDLITYVNIFNKIRLNILSNNIYTVDELNIEYNKYIAKKKSVLAKYFDRVVKNTSREKREKLLETIYVSKSEITDSEKNNIINTCNYYGLDSNEILRLYTIYNNKLQITKMIKDWNYENDKYIPYFNNSSIVFIYISAYSSLYNISDYKLYKNNELADINSLVSSNLKHYIIREEKDRVLNIKHLSKYNPIIHSKANIPALIYPLENRKIKKYAEMFYTYILPDMLNEYLLPEDIGTNINKKNNKKFNQKLLELFILFRTNL